MWRVLIICLTIFGWSFTESMPTGGAENFQEFFVYPDDANDQVKLAWMPKKGVAIQNYYLEKSRNNEQYEVWKRTEGVDPSMTPSKYFEVDFDPFQGWSYYRIREVTTDGSTNYTPAIPVFIGIKNLRKGERMVAKPLVGEGTKKISLFEHDGKSYILVLRDQNGEEHLYDQQIRASNKGLYIEQGSGLLPGKHTITASSSDDLMGLNILVK